MSLAIQTKLEIVRCRNAPPSKIRCCISLRRTIITDWDALERVAGRGRGPRRLILRFEGFALRLWGSSVLSAISVQPSATSGTG